ncbi:hypothetical protein [Streptomyces coelicoflavus]|uniref:WXG100-like domain-containing protein n=1 Tax=Streptomyces coelicoflavus TaxID=285562 RepID=UPI003F4A4941
MSLDPNESVKKLFSGLTGQPWIDADEDLAYTSGQDYSGHGWNSEKLAGLIRRSVHDIAGALPDDVARAYSDAMRSLIDDGGKNPLIDFAGQLYQIAEGRRKTSMDIMEAKWQMIAEVVLLMAQIAFLLALSFFTGGVSASQILLARLRSRLRILLIMSQLLQRFHVLPSLSEAFQEAFTTFAVRLAMMNFAPDGRRPDGIDWNDILKSAAFGAAAGAFTSIFDNWARSIVKSFDNDFLKHGPDLGFKDSPNPQNKARLDLTGGSPRPAPGPDPELGPDPGTTRGPDGTGSPANGSGAERKTPLTFRDDPLSFRNNSDLWRNNQLIRDNVDRPGALAVHYGLKGATDFVAAGAGEGLAEYVIKGAFDGEWSFSWSTFVGAGVSSQVESTLSDTALNSGAELRHTIDRLRHQPPPTVTRGDGGPTRQEPVDGSPLTDAPDGSSPDTRVVGGGSPLTRPPVHSAYPPGSDEVPSLSSPGTVAPLESDLWQRIHRGPAEVRERALRELTDIRGSQPPSSAEIEIRDTLHSGLSGRPEIRLVPIGTSPTTRTDADWVSHLLDSFGTPVTVAPAIENTPITQNTPIRDSVLLTDDHPVTRSTPAPDDSPLTDNSPVTDYHSVTGSTPDLDNTPLTRSPTPLTAAFPPGNGTQPTAGTPASPAGNSTGHPDDTTEPVTAQPPDTTRTSDATPAPPHTDTPSAPRNTSGVPAGSPHTPPSGVTTDPPRTGTTGPHTISGPDATPSAQNPPPTPTSPLTIVVSDVPPSVEGTPEAAELLDKAGTDRAVVLGPAITPDGAGRPVRAAVELTREAPGAPVKVRPLSGPLSVVSPDTGDTVVATTGLGTATPGSVDTTQGSADSAFPDADVLFPLADALGTSPAPETRPATQSTGTHRGAPPAPPDSPPKTPFVTTPPVHDGGTAPDSPPAGEPSSREYSTLSQPWDEPADDLYLESGHGTDDTPGVSAPGNNSAGSDGSGSTGETSSADRHRPETDRTPATPVPTVASGPLTKPSVTSTSGRITVRPAERNSTVDDKKGGPAEPPGDPVVTTLDGHTVPVTQLRLWASGTASSPPSGAVNALIISQSPAEDGTPSSAKRRELLGASTFRHVRITSASGSPASQRAVFTGPPTALPGLDAGLGAQYAVMHGTSRRAELGSTDPAYPTVSVSGVQLGKVIQHLGVDRPLVLYSCEAGQQPQVAGLPLAQHVTNQTGQSVWAPTSKVGTARDADGNTVAVLVDRQDGPGQWRLFTPEPGGADLDRLARDIGLHVGPEPVDPFVRARTLQQVRTLREILGPDAEKRPEHLDLFAGLAFVDSRRWFSPHTAARYGDGRMTPDLLRRMVVDRAGATAGDVTSVPSAGPTVEEYKEFLRAAAELRSTAGPETTLDGLVPPPPPPPVLPPNTLVSPEEVRDLAYAPSVQITWSLSRTPLPLSELALSPEDTAELARRKGLAPAMSPLEKPAGDPAPPGTSPTVSGPVGTVHADGSTFRRLDTPGDGNCLFRALLDSARSQDIPPAWAARDIAGLRRLLRDRLDGSELAAVADEALPDPVLAVVDDLRLRALTGAQDPGERQRITDDWNRVAEAVVNDGDPGQWKRILRDSGYPELATVAPTPTAARQLGTRGLLTASAELPGLWSSPFADLLPQGLAHTLDLDVRIVAPDQQSPGNTHILALNPGGRGGTLYLDYNGFDHYSALAPLPHQAPATGPDPAASGPEPGDPFRDWLRDMADAPTLYAPEPGDPFRDWLRDMADAPTLYAPEPGDPFRDWLRDMADAPTLYAPEPVPPETQLERNRPARLLTGPDVQPPGPAPRTVTFEDGSRLPTVLLHPDADPDDGRPDDAAHGTRPTGLFPGPGVHTLRSPEQVAQEILKQVPENLRKRFDKAELLGALTDQPSAFTAPRGARFVGREKSGTGLEMTVEAVPYHRWKHIPDVNDGTVRVDTMHRGQSGIEGARSVGTGRRIAAAVGMGPPLNWLLKISFSLGWSRRTDYNQSSQSYHQSEYRGVDGSRLYLDDVYYRVRVDRVTRAPQATGQDTSPGAPSPGPGWVRSQVHSEGFAMRDGLSWRLPTDLTVPFAGPRRAPKKLTFPDGVGPRLTETAGLHLTDPPEELALAISGARPGSSAHHTLVDYVRPQRLLSLFGRFSAPVSGPELTRGHRQRPLGHLVIERSIPHRATLVTESVTSELREITQTTYRNQRAHVRETRLGLQTTSGPSGTVLGPETDVRIQGGPLVRGDFGTGRSHHLGSEAARKTTGRVRNHPIALYRVERTLMVRKAGEPSSAARPFRVVSLDWISTQDARRLAGWDSRTPGQTGPDPAAEPPVPWYLTRNDPIHLGSQIRAEGFRPVRRPGPAPDETSAPDGGQDPARNRQSRNQAQNHDQDGQTGPQDPLRVFSDAVLDTLHRSYPSLFVPPLVLRHPRLARLWYGDGRMRTALYNDRQVREALNHPTLKQSLDVLTTTGVPVSVTEGGKVRRGHHVLILRARLTDRQFETTLSERSLRNALVGTEVSGQGQHTSSTVSGGVEVGISPRDHNKVSETGLRRQVGSAAVGARWGGTRQKVTRNTLAVVNDHLSYHNGADLYSYEVRLSASVEGHRRPRRFPRFASVGLLGAGVFVSRIEESALFDEEGETVCRVELAVPSAHGSSRHAPADLQAGEPSRTPEPEQLSPTEADELIDGTGPPVDDSADRQLTRRVLSAPHVVAGVEGGPQRQQLMQDTADRASGTSWHVGMPGAPLHTALRRAVANLSIAAQLGQYLGPFGSRISGLVGAGPLQTHYLRGAIRGELGNLRVKSDPKPATLEATLGNEHRLESTESTASRVTAGVQGADRPLQQASQGGVATIGSYTAGLQYNWGKTTSVSRNITPGRNTTLTFSGRMYLVVADVVETISVRDRWTAVLGTVGTRAGATLGAAAGRLSGRLGRVLTPRGAAAALHRLRDAVMFQLPMQDAIESGLAPDGMGSTTPRNLAGGYRVPAFLRSRRFATHSSGQLDASGAARALTDRLRRFHVPSADREQILQRLSPDFLRANLHELTTDGMPLPVRLRVWNSPHHLPVGGSPAEVRFKLTPVTTTVERLRTGIELEDYRNSVRDDTEASSRDRGGELTAAVGARTADSGPLAANPSLQSTAAEQASSTRIRTTGSTAMPNVATTQAHAEIVTGYTLTVTMTDRTGEPLIDDITVPVGSLNEFVPAGLLTPDGNGHHGKLTEQDIPEPERAVRMLTASQARPEGIAEWRTSSSSDHHSGDTATPAGPDIVPFDDRTGSGILAVDILGAPNVQDALTLATARADGLGDSDLGNRHVNDTLAERVRMARLTPLTALGTTPAQTQQEATTQIGLTAGFRQALSANGSPLPTQASARLLGQSHTADSRLYAKMHRRGARLLAVENKPRMEAMQRQKISDTLTAGTTDNVEGTVGTAPLMSTGNAGLLNPGGTVPVGGANDGSPSTGTTSTTLGTHIKVVTDRTMLFALPVSWLAVADVDHHITDGRPLHALGKPKRGPRAVEAETTALVWLREDMARDYGLLNDTTFPDDVVTAWDSLAKAVGDLTEAERSYYDARARAREAWLDMSAEERAALGDEHPDRATVLPQAIAQSTAVATWQAAREDVRRWQRRTDAAAQDHHRLHLYASRLTAHHRNPVSVRPPDQPQTYTEPDWRSKAPEPYTVTDGTGSGPRTLTSPDGSTVREVHAVPHDGASFFHALLAVAQDRGRIPHLLGTDLAERFTSTPGDPEVTAEAVDTARKRLAWALGEDGNEDLLDALALDVSDSFTQSELDAAGVQLTPAQQAEFNELGRLPQNFWATPAQRVALATAALSRPFASEPQQDGAERPDGEPAPPDRRPGAHGGADLLPALAARVLGTPLTVVTEHGHEQVFLPRGFDPVAVSPAHDPVLFATEAFFHAALPPGTPAPVTTALPEPTSETAPAPDAKPAEISRTPPAAEQRSGAPKQQHEVERSPKPPVRRSPTSPPGTRPTDSDHETPVPMSTRTRAPETQLVSSLDTTPPVIPVPHDPRSSAEASSTPPSDSDGDLPGLPDEEEAYELSTLGAATATPPRSTVRGLRLEPGDAVLKIPSYETGLLEGALMREYGGHLLPGPEGLRPGGKLVIIGHGHQFNDGQAAADEIRALYNGALPAGVHIHMVVCRAGDGAYPPAQRLADELGRPVVASTIDVSMTNAFDMAHFMDVEYDDPYLKGVHHGLNTTHTRLQGSFYAYAPHEVTQDDDGDIVMGGIDPTTHTPASANGPHNVPSFHLLSAETPQLSTFSGTDTTDESRGRRVTPPPAPDSQQPHPPDQVGVAVNELVRRTEIFRQSAKRHFTALMNGDHREGKRPQIPLRYTIEVQEILDHIEHLAETDTAFQQWCSDYTSHRQELRSEITDALTALNEQWRNYGYFLMFHFGSIWSDITPKYHRFNYSYSEYFRAMSADNLRSLDKDPAVVEARRNHATTGQTDSPWVDQKRSEIEAALRQCVLRHYSPADRVESILELGHAHQPGPSLKSLAVLEDEKPGSFEHNTAAYDMEDLADHGFVFFYIEPEVSAFRASRFGGGDPARITVPIDTLEKQNGWVMLNDFLDREMPTLRANDQGELISYVRTADETLHEDTNWVGGMDKYFSVPAKSPEGKLKRAVYMTKALLNEVEDSVDQVAGLAGRAHDLIEYEDDDEDMPYRLIRIMRQLREEEDILKAALAKIDQGNLERLRQERAKALKDSKDYSHKVRVYRPERLSHETGHTQYNGIGTTDVRPEPGTANILVGADVVPGLALRCVVEIARVERTRPHVASRLKSMSGEALVRVLLKDFIRPQAMLQREVPFTRADVEFKNR